MDNASDDIDPRRMIDALRARAAYFSRLADEWEQALNGIAPSMSGQAESSGFASSAEAALADSTPARGIPKISATRVVRPPGHVPPPDKLKETIRQALRARKCRLYELELLTGGVDRFAIEEVLRANPSDFVETQGWWRLVGSPVGHATAHPEV